MSAPVCESKWQCQLNGLAGTAMFMSLMVLVWAVLETLIMDAMRDTMFIALLLPTVVSVVYVAAMRMRQQVIDWLGLAIAAGGTVWGVFVLNGGV